MKKPFTDYYALLEIDSDADQNEIKKAYQKLAMKYHPDRNPSPEAETRFKDIAKAYAILSDPEKRAQYDAMGHEGVAHFSDSDLFSSINFGDLFASFGHAEGSFFDSFFKQGVNRADRGENVAATLLVSLERIDKGGEEQLSITHPVVCHECSGSGAKPPSKPRTCNACHGSGRKLASEQSSSDGFRHLQFQTISQCAQCGGRGVLIDHPCDDCHGAGQRDINSTVKIKIPEGLKEGATLRVQGYGKPASGPHGLSGDLLVTVETKADPRFDRIGADLWHDQLVGVLDLILGTKIRVHTLNGTKTLKLPEGTQVGQVFRFKGEGISRYGGLGKGDLNIRIQTHIPEQISLREKGLYQELKKLEQKNSKMNSNRKSYTEL